MLSEVLLATFPGSPMEMLCSSTEFPAEPQVERGNRKALPGGNPHYKNASFIVSLQPLDSSLPLLLSSDNSVCPKWPTDYPIIYLWLHSKPPIIIFFSVLNSSLFTSMNPPILSICFSEISFLIFFSFFSF